MIDPYSKIESFMLKYLKDIQTLAPSTNPVLQLTGPACDVTDREQ